MTILSHGRLRIKRHNPLTRKEEKGIRGRRGGSRFAFADSVVRRARRREFALASQDWARCRVRKGPRIAMRLALLGVVLLLLGGILGQAGAAIPGADDPKAFTDKDYRKAGRKNNLYKLVLLSVAENAMTCACKMQRSRHGFAASFVWSLSNWTSGDVGNGRRRNRAMPVGAGFRWWLVPPACPVQRSWRD